MTLLCWIYEGVGKEIWCHKQRGSEFSFPGRQCDSVAVVYEWLRRNPPNPNPNPPPRQQQWETEVEQSGEMHSETKRLGRIPSAAVGNAPTWPQSRSSNNGGPQVVTVLGLPACRRRTTGSLAADCFDWPSPRQSPVQRRGMSRPMMIPPVLFL